jgi:hypothetical protein
MLYASDICNAVVKQEFPGHLEICPFHKLWGKLPNVSKMLILGCAAYVFHNNDRSNKFTPTDSLGIFCGIGIDEY